MRILVHEFVSGGGFAGRPVPPSLAREGTAMRDALVADLAATGAHRIVTTADVRFPYEGPSGVEVVPVSHSRSALPKGLAASADAVWLVAPETGRCLERLALRIESAGPLLLGSSAAAIRRASDKGGLARLLRRQGIPHPETRIVERGTDCVSVAREIGYPLVVKPARGAGCEGVVLVRTARELPWAIDVARQVSPRGAVLLQAYVHGVPCSVSLLVNGKDAVALTLNRQSLRVTSPVASGFGPKNEASPVASGFGRKNETPPVASGFSRKNETSPVASGFSRKNEALRFSYHGGRTPLDHPLASEAQALAVRTCEALPGLRGYVGVDMVLTPRGAVVIEVNPRLTTAYLGVRAAVEGNVAARAAAACAGQLPRSVTVRRRVRFGPSGRVARV
jgi:predicted ATP-grasp superfamily ATP-dependent carboligase